MIFKIYYQENAEVNPVRENTHSLYVEGESESQVRKMMADNTAYNVEFIEQLSDAALAYEKESRPDFKITEFNK